MFQIVSARASKKKCISKKEDIGVIAMPRSWSDEVDWWGDAGEWRVRDWTKRRERRQGSGAVLQRDGSQVGAFICGCRVYCTVVMCRWNREGDSIRWGMCKFHVKQKPSKNDCVDGFGLGVEALDPMGRALAAVIESGENRDRDLFAWAGGPEVC